MLEEENDLTYQNSWRDVAMTKKVSEVLDSNV